MANEEAVGDSLEKVDILKNATAEAIKEVMEYVRATADFAIEQAPELAQQLLMYSAASEWVKLAFGALWLLPVAMGVLIMWSEAGKHKDSGDNDSGAFAGGFIVFMLCGIIFLHNSYHSILVLIKIHWAPKLFILEKLSALI